MPSKMLRVKKVNRAPDFIVPTVSRCGHFAFARSGFLAMPKHLCSRAGLRQGGLACHPKCWELEGESCAGLHRHDGCRCGHIAVRFRVSWRYRSICVVEQGFAKAA
jgi:hypothetical protein